MTYDANSSGMVHDNSGDNWAMLLAANFMAFALKYPCYVSAFWIVFHLKILQIASSYNLNNFIICRRNWPIISLATEATVIFPH